MNPECSCPGCINTRLRYAGYERLARQIMEDMRQEIETLVTRQQEVQGE